MSLADLRDAYAAGMHLSDDELWAVDFIAAAVLSSKATHDSEPLFGAVIGPPSTGKTELLRPYFDWTGLTRNLSEVTANGLVSGAPNIGQTFLQSLDRRTMLIPDLTPMLQAPPMKRDQFFGVIRSIFDRSYVKISGAAGGSRHVKSRVTILTASTEIIQSYAESDVDMGQRFVFIRSVHRRSRARQRMIAKLAIDTGADSGSWRAYVQSKVHELFVSVRDRYTDPKAQVLLPHEKPPDASAADWNARVDNHAEELGSGWAQVVLPDVKLAPQHLERLISYSAVVTRARSGKTNSADGHHGEEGYIRVLKQLVLLVRCRALLDNRTSTNDHDIELARRVTLDTVDPSRMQLLTRAIDQPLTLEAAGEIVGRTPQAAAALLQHYASNGVLIRSPGVITTWTLDQDMRDDLAAATKLPTLGPP